LANQLNYVGIVEAFHNQNNMNGYKMRQLGETMNVSKVVFVTLPNKIPRMS